MWLNGCEVISLTRQPQNSTGPVWTDNDLPACPDGMDLLRQFKEARPNDYAFLHWYRGVGRFHCALRDV